jgi:hypothetical protein
MTAPTLKELIRSYYPKQHHPIHTLHPYPHKLVPSIARALIQHYSREHDTILDPFCGSGTALVEALMCGRHAIGYDSNPLAYAIARAKIALLCMDRTALHRAHQHLSKRLTVMRARRTSAPTLHDFMPLSIPCDKKWFQSHVGRELKLLQELLQQHSMGDKCLTSIFTIMFSSLVKKVSNSSSLHKLSFKQKNVPPLRTLHLFQQHLTEILHYATQHTPCKTHGHVEERDTRRSFSCSADLIVTRIPSFNTDFVRSFKLHFWWLYAEQDVKALMKRLNHRVIGARQRTDPNTLARYFDGLQRVLWHCYSVLRRGKYCCIYSTDCTSNGIQIQVRNHVVSLAEHAGFTLVDRLERIIPRQRVLFSKTMKKEEILVLQKT